MAELRDILIAGGGLGGTALALALAEAGHAVTLVDPEPVKTRRAAGFDGRSYALSLASQKMLAAIGLWPALEQDAQAIREVKVSDGRAGEGGAALGLHFDQAELDDGPMGYMVEDRHIRRALLDRVAEQDRIAHLAGRRVTGQSVTGGGIDVTLDGDETRAAVLLIGADGRQSGTGQRAGIARTEWGYGQTALVCAIAHELPHHGIAHQFFMPPGPLAILPLRGNRSSIVWSETEAEAARLAALPEAAWLDHLRPRFGSFLGEIALEGKRYSYPLALSLAESFVAPRVALVGDAAHALHPIAGQGLNAGLRDVAALAEVLTDARRRGEDIGSADVLARYQRWRRFDTATLALATDGFNRLFSNDNPALRLLRDAGMGVVQSLPALRRGFIREAAGLTGDRPRLLRGEPL